LEGLNGTPVTYANTYESLDGDLIAAVGTFFNESQPYNLTITTKSGTYNQTGVSNYYGYQLIHLNKYVPVKEYENFTVSITSTYAAITKTRNIIPPNSSYSNCYGSWTDLTKNGSVAILKAYTIQDNSKVLVKNLTTKYNSGEYLIAQFIDEKSSILNNSFVEYKLNDKIFNATTDENGFVYIGTNLAVGRYTVLLYNPVNKEEINVTLIIESNCGKNVIEKYYHSTIKNYQKHGKYYITYTLLVKNNKIYEGKYITIDTLNKIFNTNFTNGHLTVYLDGILIFNDTVKDNIWKIILEITEKYMGTHEIKIEYTNNNKTQTYTENITIT